MGRRRRRATAVPHLRRRHHRHRRRRARERVRQTEPVRPNAPRTGSLLRATTSMSSSSRDQYCKTIFDAIDGAVIYDKIFSHSGLFLVNFSCQTITEFSKKNMKKIHQARYMLLGFKLTTFWT